MRLVKESLLSFFVVAIVLYFYFLAVVAVLHTVSDSRDRGSKREMGPQRLSRAVPGVPACRTS
jgi:hypothetical protein